MPESATVAYRVILAPSGNFQENLHVRPHRDRQVRVLRRRQRLDRPTGRGEALGGRAALPPALPPRPLRHEARRSRPRLRRAVPPAASPP